MSRFTGALVVLVVLALVMLFARANGGEFVTLDLGFRTFRRIPLTYVAFGGLFVGMLVMLLAGIHSDLKVRRFLRERLEAEARDERAPRDRNQQDLFASRNEDGPNG
ncbi:MAG: hypothetical protein WD013_00510 [Gemmatimonadota bacterium]